MYDYEQHGKNNIQDLLQDEGVVLPRNIMRIMLDVGLSREAHQSETFLRHNSKAVSFGFEPLPENISTIRGGGSDYITVLDPARIGESFFLIPCAIDRVGGGACKPFNVTHDTGCSSLKLPVSFPLREVIYVPVYTLEEFLRLLDWDTISYIDFLKIDTQGSDLDVFLSAGKFIQKIFIVTCEITVDQYVGVVNSTKKIFATFLTKGFLPITFGKNYPKLSKLFKFIFWFICKIRNINIDIQSVDPTYFNVGLFLSTKLRNIKIVIT